MPESLWQPSHWGEYPPPPLHPDPTEKVHQRWQDDELFGYQFLNGANPMLLRRSTSLPSRLQLPSGMEELQAQLEKELQVPPPALYCSVLEEGRRSGGGEGATMRQGREAVTNHCPLERSPLLEAPEMAQCVGETMTSSPHGFPGCTWGQRC